jgi:protein SCO1
MKHASIGALLAGLLVSISLPGTAAQESALGQAPTAPFDTAFELTDQRGLPFSATQLRGRFTLLTFGFTHCSSTCPVSMHVAREVVASLGAQAPQVVLVTLDPLSDDPSRLHKYLRQFDARFVGLTGSPQAIERVAAQFRVGLRGAGKTLAHSAMWYLIGPRGDVQRVYPFSTPPAQLVDELRRLNRTEVAAR